MGDGGQPTQNHRLRVVRASAVVAVLLVAGSTCRSPPDEADGSAGRTVSNPTLPGLGDGDPALVRRLRAGLKARGSGYRPRTHHLDSGGSPLYTNRLILETSPYLLQHAHNPMNWYPWGDEAFEAARMLRRPVLLSVGYSTCHWCHVMEEESFEDVEIARFINENYIPIKVDREERPDVDSIYMTAVHALTGRGGWPMTVWLTRERKPFFGGTYFPARDGDRGTRKGFLTLLRDLKARHETDPDGIASAAEQTTRDIARQLAPDAPSGLPTSAVLDNAVRFYSSRFDATYGGLNRAPKFPSSLPIRFLLRVHRRTGDENVVRMASVTLERMAAGGMYDQIGGGFHRYSTDRQWLVPHFEKMLYDNALLVVAYLDGYQVTGREDFADVAGEILEWVATDMTSPDGAFYSAVDADRVDPAGRREEGRFFTWTPEEIDAALPEASAALVNAYYGVSPTGNFEGRGILHVTTRLDEVAAGLGLSPDRSRVVLAEAREALLTVRRTRPAPLRDDKIIAGWNGLMISALARAALVLADTRYADRAVRAAEFLLGRMRRGGRLVHTYKDGRASADGYLDDLAFVIAGLLDLFEATGETRWLREAIALDAELREHFEDEDGGGFFFTGNDDEHLLAREKPGYDGAEPSGNSVHVLNLLRLHLLTDRDEYRARAEHALKAFGAQLSGSPSSISEMLLAVDFHLDTPKEIVIVTTGPREEAEPFLAKLRRAFLPNRVLVVVPEDRIEDLDVFLPLVQAKVTQSGRATAYVCERRVCDLPTTDPEVFAAQIRRVRSLPTSSGAERGRPN